MKNKEIEIAKFLLRKLSPQNLKNLPAYIKSGNLPLVIKETLTNCSEILNRKDTTRPADVQSIKGLLEFFGNLKLQLFLESHLANLEFPVHHHPRISVILVLYNKASYTFQCLESILAHADVPYEILIVDNASDDETGLLLDRLRNVRVIKNNENVGFLKACNQGSREARGDWLLFLNNDTQILPNLFSSLLDASQQVKNCGAVGGKLILPDGRLQEAGSIIWNDGTCLGYGRGDDPWKPEFSYLREVDYCSGACLMVNAALFRQIGMFDEQFAPAYYEETDLCMSIRKCGHRVIYQPAAQLIHYEFGSSASKEKALAQQRNNAELFRSKWKEELKSLHAPPANQNIFDARERTDGRTRILFIEDRVPDPLLGAGFPRSFDVINALVDLDIRVTVFPTQIPERREQANFDLQQRGVEVLYGKSYERLDLQGFLAERADSFDLIWICRPNNLRDMQRWVSDNRTRYKIVYDAEALFALRDINKATLTGSPFTEKQQQSMILQEVNMMSGADVIVTVSEVERQLVTACSQKPVMVVSHTHELRPTEASFRERRDMLFVGGFLGSPSPNEDAMQYFVSEIFPLIRQKIDAKLWIVGTNKLPSIERLASENIIVTGTVPTLGEYFNRCRVFVVPTRYAAGIPHKLLEAMSHGIPAVVTPLIAQQLQLGQDLVLIGADPREFADKVIECYSSEQLWETLRRNGLKRIVDNYSKKGFVGSIADVLRSCGVMHQRPTLTSTDRP